MKSFTKSFLSILLCFLLNLLITGNLKAHTWEVRVNQNPDGSLTWYLQNWHSFSEQACHDYANQSGLVINGVQYPVQSVHQGSIVPLSPTIFGACSTNDNRDCYGIINTPFLGSPLSVSTYSNVACWASCGIQAQGNFNPPPPPVCTTCPIIDFDSNVSCSDNGTICTSTDDIYTFSITVNHLACASITGDGQFTVIVDPGGANIVLGPFNYNSGITTDVFLPAGTVNGTTIKVLDDDFPCDFQDQLSVDPSLLMGCSVDNDYPTFINCPQGVTFTVGLFSGSCTGGAIWSIPIAEDECGVVVTQTDGPMLGEILTAGSYHLEYTATDPSGNTTICSFTIEVLDTEEPVIVCPANCVVSHTDPGVCTWTSPAGCFTPLLAASNCPATISWEVVNPDGTTSTGNDDVSGYTFQLGTSTVTYTIEETASGQTWTCSFTVTVEDNEVPVIECPADIVVVNDQGECGAVVTFDDPNVTDNCTLPTANSSITFDYTGAEQTWTVPAGVTSITIQSWGGQGGESRSCTGGPDPEFDGGLGGFASGTLSVTPGQVIYINVGGKGLVGNDGTADGGWNGGGDGGFWAGGGGGASDIRTVSGDLNTRVIVAAGGGGGNTGCPNHGQGGDGGGLIGLDGLSFFGWDPSTGGTQGAGGLGGGSGQNGSFGQGGGTNPGDEYHVGGGGGGWYGGGSAYAAGGSGGSSYIDGVTGGTTMSGAQSGNGVVIISYGMGSPLSQVSGLPSGDVFPVGVTENVFWATDASGNTASCSFTVTVTDEEKPEIECPENANIPTSNLGTTGDCAGQYTWEHPVPTDNCGVVHYTVMYTNADGTIDGPFDVYTTSSSVGLNNGPATGNRHFDLGVTNITYTVEDANGNVETCSFTVTVTDDEDPTFVNCPEGVTFTVGLFSDDCQGGAIWSIPIADDNCGATVSQTDGPLQGAILGVGTYAIQYTATDAANNTATCNFTIEVIDTEDPVIVCPGNVVIDETDPGVCTWTSPANSLTPLLAASNCPAEITWEVVNPDGGTETGNNDVSGYTFQLGTSTVTYTIEETASGQTWTCSFTVTVEDHEDPMIECPADIVVVNDPGECGAVVTFDDPTISDNCEINGSSEEVIFDYTGAEQTWVVPAGVTSIMVNAIGAKGGDGASTQGGLGGQVTATLAVTPGETLRIYVGGQGNTCDDISPSPCQNGGFNGGGNTNVTCNSPGNPQHAGTGGGASDIRRGGNALTDRILVAAGGGGGGFASFGPPSPGGNGGGLDGEDAPDWSGFVQGMGGSQIAGGAPSPQGGTAGSLGQGGEGEASCGGGGGGGGGYYGGGGGWVGGGGGGSSYADPGATDVVHVAGVNNGDGMVIITYSGSLIQTAGLPSGSNFPVGVTENIFVVTDGSGNTASCSFTVTVTDEEDPAISCPEGYQITTSNLGTLGDCAGQLNWSHPIPTDNCGIGDHDFVVTNPDGTIDGPFDGYQISTGTIAPDASRHFDIGTSTVTYYVQDIHGNTVSCNFTVMVTDDEDPTFVNCPAAGTIVDVFTNDCVTGANWAIPLATDNCLGVTVAQTDGPLQGSLIAPGTYTIEYTATDAAGNQDICSFTINVQDTENPVIVNCPFEDQILEVNADCEGILPDFTTRIQTLDNCGPITIEQLPAAGTNYVVGDVVDVTITVEDDHGNQSVCTIHVLVQDNTAPVALCNNLGFGSTFNYQINFESGLQGWTTGNDATTTLGIPSIGSTWALSTQTGGPSPFNLGGTWFGTPNMGSMGAERSWIQSPVFAVSSGMVTINFDSYSSNEPGYPTFYDVEHVQISENGGPFVDIHGEDAALHNWADQTIRNITYTATVTPGSDIQLRFLYDTGDGCCGPSDITGWFIDNVSIQAQNQTLAVSLDANGEAVIDVSDIDGGSYDNCGIEDISLNITEFNCTHIGSNTVTMTVTDVNGNTSSCIAEVVIVDDLAPVAECQNLDLTLNEFGHVTINVADIDNGSSDNCAIISQTLSQTFFDCSNTGANTVTMILVDAAGNQSSCDATVTVTDNIDPEFVNCPQGVTFTVGLFSDDCQGGAIWSVPVATDNCSAEVLQTGGPLQGDILVVGTYNLEYTATDPSGNQVVCNFTIEVIDTEDPVIVCPGNVVVDETDPGVCTWTSPANSLTPLLAASNCPAEITWEVVNPDASTATGNNDVSGYVFELGTSTVTYTIEETASGQTWTCSFTVTVEDHEDPMIECPADIVVVNDPGECGAVVTFDDPTISDNCEINGSSEEVIFDYTGAEQTWVVPAGVTSIMVNAIGAKGGDGASTQGGLGGQVTATLAVTPGETLRIYVGGQGNTCDDISPSPCQNGGFNGGGNTNVTCNDPGNPQHAGTGGGASDIRRGGNALTDRILVAAGGGGGGFASFGPPSPGGNGGGLDGEDAATWEGFVQGMGGTQVNGGAPSPQGGTAGSLGQGGEGEASCGGGGGGGGGYYGGGGGWVGGGGGGSSYADPGASNVVHLAGVNNGDGMVIITYSGALIQTAGLPSGSNFPVGVTENVFVVTDGSGNTASCSFTVTVTDEEDPTISCPEGYAITTSNLGTLGDCAGQLNWSHPLPSDNCDVADHDFVVTNPDGTIDGPFDGYQISTGTIAPDASRHFEVGVSFVTYYVEDVHGNTTSCSFSVSVTDDEDPAFVNCPASITVGNDVDKCGSNVVFSTPIASDNCGASVTLVPPSLPSGSLFPVGESDVVFRAIDEAGNDVLCEFTITVTDMQTPTAVCQDITVYLDNDGNVSIVADDVDGGSTDNCDDLSLSINVSEFDCDNVGDNLVTLTVEDGNENTSICVSTVTVVDSVAPTFTCPNNITVDGCDDLIPDVITGITDEADNCGVASVVQDPVAGLDFGQTNGNSVDITVTVTDVNGNVSSCVVLLIIEDDDEPDFLNCPTAMIMIGNDPDQCSGKVNWQPPVAVDDCLPLPISAPGIPLPGTVVQTTGPLPGTAVAITCPPTPSTITYVATDANGNTSSCTFQVMVVDTEEPEFDADIIMPNDTTVDCHLVPINCVYHGPNVCTPLTNNDVNDNCTSPADLDITFEEISTQNPNPAVCGHYDYDLTRIWTVTDCAGNQLVHTQQIEVQDTTKPVAVCKNITVTLDDFGNATITPRDLDGGSTDNCAENQYLTFTASQTLFTCADLPNSPITVILTVTDPCGNFSTCTAIVTVLEGNGDCTPEYDIDGSDPCICLDNATTLDNGQFGEVIQIHGLAGQTWRVFSSTGLYLATSPAPPAAPIPVPSNALLTNGQVDGYDNDGDTVIDELDERVYYTYTGRHVDGQGYSAIIRSNLNDQVQLENKCYYPTPYFTDELYLDDPLCIGTPPFTIKVAELNNAAGGVVPGSIMVNGVVTTVFDAGNLGLGAHTVMATFNAGAAQPFTKVNGVVVAGSEAAAIADPGCNQKITKVVNVVETPVTLICNDLVYVSIDADCVESIDADDVLEGTYFCLDDYRVEVDKTLPYGNGPWVPADFNAADIGKTYQYRVIRITGAANICWGEIKIEDKLAPALTCPVDVTIACSESTEMQHTGNILIADCSNTTTVVDDEYTDFGQCSDPRGQLVRTWIVTDTWGNQAACEQIITITKFDLDDVVFPTDVTVDCEVTYLNPDGIASVNTGEPSINGASIIGSTWCGAQVGFNDTYFYGCGGTFTILREWGVLNNCEPLGPGNPVTYTQRILVNDLGGPTFNCPPAVTVSTNPFECCSNTALPSMLVSEGCSGILDLEAKVTGIDPNNGNIITFTVGGHLEDFPGNNYWNPDTLAVFNYTQCLPLGTYDVRYKASDECGNTSYCNFALTIADLIPPTVSCDQVTQVALSNDGVAVIPAANLNDGTADNCCLDFFEVRRMDGGSCTGTDFAPEVQFCCSDIGDTLMVVFRAWDCHGNYNDCMVSVLVEDKIKPACQPPANVSVNCENFDPSLWSYGIPDVLDNCCLDTNKVFLGQIGLTHSVNYTLFDTVCNKGTITRTFRAFDCSGNSSQCTQRVFVNYLQDYFVKFPNDAIVTTCDGTGNFGEPLFFGEDCELLGVSHTDDIFTVVPDACFKIERTWQIINWCTFNPNLPLIEVPNPSPNPISNASANLPGPTVSACGTIAPWAPTVVKINPTDPTATNYCTFWQADANGYKYKQIIKVQDGQAPTGSYIVPACDNQNWFTPNNNQLWNEMYWWDNGIQTHDLCEEPTDLSFVGTDACSGANVNIEYLLFLDLDNDGTMETVVNSVNTGLAGLGWNNVLYNNLNTPNFGGGTPRAFDERPVPTNQKYGFAIQESVQGTNKTASVRWNTQQQQNNYVIPELPHGTHKIKWFVTDGCGNNSEYEYTFTVKDCKAPTVVCINGLSVNIMPTGMIQLWASDFLQYTEDNCTPAGQIRIGIRKCGTGTGFPVDAQGNPITNVIFDCTELGTQCVELWAMDAAGNADYCETYVIVQDNLGGCPNADKLNVVGELKTEMTEGVEEAMVHINGTSTFAPPYSYFDLTDTLGLYAVTNSVPLAATFTIAPEKDDNPLNGVTTYDLVLMSKHILGLEPLNSPYKMIAADANKSGSITTFDIVELRKLILGIYTELPNNTSWRFVDKAFVFPNANNPFQSQFPETISVADAMVSQIGEDFVGVKVGDVNSTAVANANMQAEDRTSGTAILDIEDRAVAAGEVFEVTFKAAEQLKGFQFTMLQDGLKTVGVKEEDGITAGNFGTIFEGATTVSVDGPQSFTLQMRAEKSGKLSEMLGVSGAITRAEAYGNAGRLNVAFRFDHKTVAGVGFELYQNQPNPFVNKTTIGFFLPEASEATLSIFDEAGRMVYQQKGQFPKGENTVVLDRALLNTVGVLYYQLETAKDMASRKMIQSK